MAAGCTTFRLRRTSLILPDQVDRHTDRGRAECRKVLAGRSAGSLDLEKNAAVADGPAAIHDTDSRVAVLVIPTDEELSIARQTVQCVRRPRGD